MTRPEPAPPVDSSENPGAPPPNQSELARPGRFEVMRARFQGPSRVWLLTAATATGGIILYMWVLFNVSPLDDTRLPFTLLLVALFAAAEIFVVHFEFRRDSHTFSLVEVPLVLGLLFARPALIVPANVVGAGLALALYRKQAPIKLMFNLAAFALEDSVAVIVFHLLAGSGDVKAFGTAAGAGAAAGVASVIGIVAVFGAITLSGGRLSPAERRQALAFGLLATAMTTSVTVTVAILANLDAVVAWLPLVPVAGIYLAHRIYVSERNERQQLEFLHQSTGLLNESQDIDWAVDALLNQARRTFGADVAALNYLPAGDLDSLSLTIVGPGDEHQSQLSVPRSPLLEAWARTAGTEGRTVTALRGDIEMLVPGVIMRNALVIPLPGETQVVGYLLVANRLSPVGRFSHDDLRVFQTLGHQVSVALENGHLEQSLQEVRVLERQVTYRATHDALTGLANDTALQESLVRRLEGRGHPARLAIIFIEVTWSPVARGAAGRGVGGPEHWDATSALVADKLRMVVAQRLRRGLRDHDIVARVGSDTFGVVFDPWSGETGEVTFGAASGAALALAKRLHGILSARVTIDQATIPIALSIGLVVDDGDQDVATLLARARSSLDGARSGAKGRINVFRGSDEISPVNS